MSITKNVVPSLVAPVYNPFYYVVSSTNTAQPNFKYVFDIYTGNTGSGALQARIKLLPRPGGSANCQFSPARILESYLSYDLVQNITFGTANTNHITYYSIAFGEEYGSLSTGTTVYSGLTWETGLT